MGNELELQLLGTIECFHMSSFENHIDTGGGMTGIHFFHEVRGLAPNFSFIDQRQSRRFALFLGVVTVADEI